MSEINTEKLENIEKEIRKLNIDEINKKINRWAKRIEQFVLLGKKDKAKSLYHELKVMVKVSQELADFQDKHILVGEENLSKALVSVDLLKRALSEYNYDDIIRSNDISFRFLSDNDSIEQIYEIAREKFQILPLSEMDKINLDFAIHEAIGNAQRHGHKYQDHLPIEFRYLYKNSKLVLQVTDKGTGFDFKKQISQKKNSDAVTEARQRIKEGGYGGLGLMMMLKCMDEVKYNHIGNRISLTKYIEEK